MVSNDQHTTDFISNGRIDRRYAGGIPILDAIKKAWFEPHLPEDISLEDLSEDEAEKLIGAWLKCETDMVRYRQARVRAAFEDYLLVSLESKVEQQYTPGKGVKRFSKCSRAEKLELLRIIGAARELEYTPNALRDVLNEFLKSGDLPPALAPPEPEPEPEVGDDDADGAGDDGEPDAEGTASDDDDDGADDADGDTATAAKAGKPSISEWIEERLAADEYITKAKDFKDFEAIFGLTRRTFIKHLRDNGLEYHKNKWIRP